MSFFVKRVVLLGVVEVVQDLENVRQRLSLWVAQLLPEVVEHELYLVECFGVCHLLSLHADEPFLIWTENRDIADNVCPF